MTDWIKAQENAARTGHWATTMTKWLITKQKAKTKWKLVTFAGPKGGESRGIVDLMAIRKDHRERTDGLKRGDIFQIILIQVKGGTAPRPSWDDIERFKKVGRLYHAKELVLAEWKKGKQPVLYCLNWNCEEGDPWLRIDAPHDLFN